MHHYRRQKGSSSAGLLTATLIFIALLVYSDQYAFNTHGQSILPSLTELFSDKEQPAAADPVVTVSDTDTIQPSAKGIFDTPTFTQDQPESVIETENTVSIKQANTTVPTSPVVTRSPEYLPQNTAPISYVSYYHPQDLAMTNSYHIANAGIHNLHYYNASSRTDGRGRSRGNMNGDGEFNFSMNFKSRARMDADTDLDADSAVYGNSYQQQLYDLNAAYYPAYGYRYYRY
jgi:hypothetical protein